MATTLPGGTWFIQGKLANELPNPLGIRQAHQLHMSHDHHHKSLATSAHCSRQSLKEIIVQLGPETDAATYASLLQRCAFEKALYQGERVHDHMVRVGYVYDTFLNNLLVQMYSKCGSLNHVRAVFDNMVYRNIYSWTIALVACTQNGSLDDARAMFAEMPHRNIVSWNAIIAGCAQNGHNKEALQLFGQMQMSGFEPNKITFICVLDACASEAALEEGREAHAIVTCNGWEQHVIVGNALVNMYGKCGNLNDARAVFQEMLSPDVVSWSSMITVYAKNGHGKQALQLFGQMQKEGFEPDRITYISVLDACASMEALEEGRAIHNDIVCNKWESDVVVGNALINMYGKCRSLDDARAVFAEGLQVDVVSWNAMIATCAQNGHGEEALQLMGGMQDEGFDPNKITFICILDACACVAALEKGREIHASIVGNGWESDVIVGTALINMYRKNGSVDDARAVFSEMPCKNVVSWTAIIAVCAENGYGEEALQLFDQMQAESIEPDEVTFIYVLDACAVVDSLEEGREIHANIVCNGWESDVALRTALVNMYGKCKSLDDAKGVFVKLPWQIVMLWNAMIAACVRNGDSNEALQLFSQMQDESIEPDEITFIYVLDACSTVGSLEEGREIHVSAVANGCESDVVVGTAFVHMYGKYGSPDDAMAVFAELPQHDLVLWNAMISVCAKNGKDKEALQLFGQMQVEGFESDKITFICVLDACGGVAALDEGRGTHACVVGNGWEVDVIVGSALINMYGKCGSLDDARAVFAELPVHDVVLWSAIISVCAQNGHGKEALQMFGQMQAEGIVPNEATFLCVLNACSHMGLVADGKQYFASMSQEYGILPSADHYTCMIDLLGRAGQLDKAEQLINSMPFEPTASAWLSLLSSCRIHGDVVRGVRAANRVFDLGERNASPFVLLANIHAAAGRQEDVERLKSKMIDKRVKKAPGRSCIEVNNAVHEFVTGDRTHPQMKHIHAELQKLNRQIEDAGYVPDTNAMIMDLYEEQNEQTLCYHSEKLALAFGLISTSSGTPICITKNLQVCSDCHSAIRFMSKIVQRKIILRDPDCIHHIEQGVCSCRKFR